MFIFDTQTHPIGVMDIDRYPAVTPQAVPPPTMGAIPSRHGGAPSGPRDWSLDKLIAGMDEHGIAKAVVMSGGTQVTNHNLAEAMRLHPDRLVAFASYGHREPDSRDATSIGSVVASLEQGLSQMGFKGVGEIHVDRFSPTPPDRLHVELRPILDACRRYRVPVYFHTGFDRVTFRLKRSGEEGSSWRHHPAPLPYRDPVYMDAVAIEYPDVPILIGHMGGRFLRHFEGALMLALRHPNVYLTTANAPSDFIARAVAEIGAQRVIWGSDWRDVKGVPPLPRMPLGHAGNLAALDEAGLTAAQKEAILGRNLAELLGVTT